VRSLWVTAKSLTRHLPGCSPVVHVRNLHSSLVVVRSDFRRGLSSPRRSVRWRRLVSRPYRSLRSPGGRNGRGPIRRVLGREAGFLAVWMGLQVVIHSILFRIQRLPCITRTGIIENAYWQSAIGTILYHQPLPRPLLLRAVVKMMSCTLHNTNRQLEDLAMWTKTFRGFHPWCLFAILIKCFLMQRISVKSSSGARLEFGEETSAEKSSNCKLGELKSLKIKSSGVS